MAVSFEFNYIGGNAFGFNDPVRALEFRGALEDAASRLGGWMRHDANIQIDVRSDQFNGFAVAHATSALPTTQPTGGFVDTVMASKVKGIADPNGVAADGELEVFFFGPGDTFTYETDPANVDADDELDFQAIIIHELLHTLGFTSATNANGSDDFGGGIGSPGNWRPYDEFLSDVNGNRFIDANPDSPTAFQMNVSPDGWLVHSVGGKGPNAGLFFDGPKATAVYGSRVPLYSPATFSLVSSVSHLDSEGALNNNPIFSPLTHLLAHAIVDRALPQELTNVEKAIFADIGIDFFEDTLPDITPPQDIELEGNSLAGFTGTDPALDAFLSGAVATDLFDDDVTITVDVPDFLPIGVNTFTFTATDDSGNQSTASAIVRVIDTTAPAIAVDPESVTLEATGSEGVTDVDLPLNITVTDVVDPDPTFQFAPGRDFPLGTTTVTVTAQDLFNNVATRDIDVVVRDTTAPTFELPLSITIPANLADGADLANPLLANQLAAAASDAVDGELTFTSSPEVIPVGITQVTFTATDDAGNATSVTTSVTVNTTSFTVTTLDDELDVDPAADPNDLSLREAIGLANDTSGTNVIFFDPALDGAVLLDPLLGSLVVTESVSIIGNGSEKTVVDGQGNVRVLDYASATGGLLLDGVTVRGGSTTQDDDGGGGVRFNSTGTLTINNSQITGNTVSGLASTGGGVRVSMGGLTIANSTFTDNATEGEFAGGGGIWTDDVDVSITQSTISGNRTTGELATGGGLYILDGSFTISQSTVSGNHTSGTRSGGAGMVLFSTTASIRDSTVAGNVTRRSESGGGGIRSTQSTVNVVNSTISGNSAGIESGIADGGGIYATRSDVNVAHSTITGNQSSGSGGGIGIPTETVNTTLTISNSIVAENNDSGSAPDFTGTNAVASDAVRFSLIGDNTGTTLAESQTPDPATGNLVGDPFGGGVLSPILEPLADNGGVTQTHALMASSPAIDAGDPLLNRELFSPSVDLDQRGEGFPRIQGNSVDIGALESESLVTIRWRNPADIDFGTALSAVQLNATSDVAGTFVYDPVAGTVLQAGDAQPLSVVFTPDDLQTFEVTTATVFIDVLKVDPTLTWNEPDPIVFGTPLDVNQLNATTAIDGTFEYTPSSGTVLGAGDDQVLSVTFTPTDTNNFNVATASVLIDVLPAAPVLTWNDPDPITAGTRLSATQLNATANIAGSFSYVPPAGVIMSAGLEQTLSVTFTPTDVDNFSPINTTVSIDVLKADPEIVWDMPGDIVVGTPLSETQLNASTEVAGTFVYDPAAGTILDVGAGQSLSATFTPNDTRTFNSVTVTTTINVVAQQDFGDAPARYPVTLAQDGARHPASSLRLGALVDNDLDGQVSDLADGDGDDDDGVKLLSDFVADPQSAATASLEIVASASGKLDAWIDFNQDGDWNDSGEQVAVSVDVVTGANVLSINVPSHAAPGQTAARFRLSSAGGLSPTGAAVDGEVEDYLFTILDGNASPDVATTLVGTDSLIEWQSDRVVVSSDGQVLFAASPTSVGKLNLDGSLLDELITFRASDPAVLSSESFALDGGGGLDTLILEGDQAVFDFTNNRVKISQLDLRSDDATTLITDAASVAALQQVTPILFVQGGVEDRVEVSDAEDWLMGTPINLNGRFIRSASHQVSGEEIQLESPKDWQNFLQASDTNNDGVVTSLDALRVVNELRRRAFSDPETSELVDARSVIPWPNAYFDQNGDGRVTSLDALRVINELRRQALAGGEGEMLVGAGEWLTVGPDGSFDDDRRFTSEQNQIEVMPTGSLVSSSATLNESPHTDSVLPTVIHDEDDDGRADAFGDMDFLSELRFL